MTRHERHEAALMIERIVYPDPWEHIDWSESALEALEMAIDALGEARITRCEDCVYCSTIKHSSGECMWCTHPQTGGHVTDGDKYCAWAKEK